MKVEMLSKCGTKGYLDQIFTLKQIGAKTIEKNRRVYKGFMALEKVYDRVNGEDLWQVLKIEYIGGRCYVVLDFVSWV